MVLSCPFFMLDLYLSIYAIARWDAGGSFAEA